MADLRGNSALGLWPIAAPFAFGVKTTVIWTDSIVVSFRGYDPYVTNGYAV